MSNPGLESLTVARWVYTTLTNDPTLQDLLGGAQGAQGRVVEGVYNGTAPTWVVFTVLDPVDTKGVGVVHVLSRVQFQVKAVGRTLSYGTLEPIYKRVHDLLESRTNQEAPALQGGIVLTAERVTGVKFPETTDGTEYRHLGGLYETITL